MVGPSPATPKPIYLRARDLPTKNTTVHETCSKCEVVSGKNTVEGAQLVNGLWRIFCKTSEARLSLLVAGFSLRGHAIALSNTNPYRAVTSDGRQESTTRLITSELPMHMPVPEVEGMLERLGVDLLQMFGNRPHFQELCEWAGVPNLLWYRP